MKKDKTTKNSNKKNIKFNDKIVKQRRSKIKKKS